METNVEFEEVKGNKPSLFGIIISPSIQFNRMKEKAPIAKALLLMLLFMAITGALVSYIGLNNPALKNLNSTTGFQMPASVMMIMGALGGIAGGAITFFITAAIYKIFMILFGNDTSYMKLVAIVIYTSIITALGSLINGLIALAMKGYETGYTSLAPLAGDNATLKAIAGNFDIFQIWHYVVLAMGFHIAAGLSKNKAITIVVILFLITIGINYAATFMTKMTGM